MSDAINSPAHYVGGRTIEPIAVIEDWDLPHHLACALKYIARCGRKGDALEDIKKARWYLDRAASVLSARHEAGQQDEVTP